MYLPIILLILQLLNLTATL